MTYEELTQEQKDDLALADKWIRGALVTLKGFTDAADFDLKLQFWTDTIAPILASLDTGELIPQASGHAGADDLTGAQLNAIKTWLEGIDSDMSDNLGLVVKAIGVNA